jgi:uncharacterized integral membrane protein
MSEISEINLSDRIAKDDRDSERDSDRERRGGRNPSGQSLYSDYNNNNNNNNPSGTRNHSHNANSSSSSRSSLGSFYTTATSSTSVQGGGGGGVRESFRRRNTNQEGLMGKSSINASQISTMTFNNQDTVLLRAETDIHICFLHDNRIYIFKKKPAFSNQPNSIISNPNCDVEYRASSSVDVEMQEVPFNEKDQSVEELIVGLILHLMTTPKYRLLNSTYVVFTTIDHWIFLSIVILLIVGYGTQTDSDFSLAKFAWSLPVSVAVMLEIFVGITMNTR